MKKILIIFFFSIATVALAALATYVYLLMEMPVTSVSVNSAPTRNIFSIQSIDTMKYSRDLSREKLKDTSFDKVIDEQVSAIKETGATHIAIGTPYDDEFLPILKRWVNAARAHNLKIWFRGNWSGWEGWFGYSRINREEHTEKTEKFISDNPDLFENGDVFSSCPECENGGAGDPRQNGDVTGYRNFLINEHERTRKALLEIHKKVETNLFPMNADVANLVMDKNTTQELGGIVTVDHYVNTPEKFIRDLELLAKKSGGQIMVGEFGVPIPDIQGSMTDAEQAEWIAAALAYLHRSSVIYGVNYWLNIGGSTAIWNDDGKAKDAVKIIKDYYQPDVVYGTVQDELGRPISGADVQSGDIQAVTDNNGVFSLKFIGSSSRTTNFSKQDYLTEKISVSAGVHKQDIILRKEHEGWKNKLIIWLQRKLKIVKQRSN
jgi:hypothetical protein